MAAATIDVDLRPLRYAGVGIIGVAALRPLLGNPGIDCPLRSLTGVPCPLCGMTRGVTDMVHGDVGGAMLMNPGSVLLVVAAVVLLVAWRCRRIQIASWTPYAAVAALWTFQLFKLLTGRPL